MFSLPIRIPGNLWYIPNKIVRRIKLPEAKNLSCLYIIKGLINSYVLFHSDRYVYICDLDLLG